MKNIAQVATNNSAVFAFKIGAVIAAAGALSACATSNVSNGKMSSLAQPRFMTAAHTATPPAGFLDFCARSPQDCGLQAGAASATDSAAPAVALVAAVQPARGGYDWSAAFAASRPHPASDQTAALRKQLYGQYMWKAAFAAARPAADPVAPAAPGYEQAPAIGYAQAAPQPANPSPFDTAVSRSAIWGAGAPEMRIASQSSGAEAQGLLIKASFAPLPQPGDWMRAPHMDIAPEPMPEAAPSMTDAGVAQPAAAMVQAHRPLTLTPALLSELNAVDRSINRAIIQTEDVRAYGQDDYWATPLEDGLAAGGRARGDCEDYALEKRRALIARGLPAEALAIAVADTRFGPHAVLLINTDQGEYVLDSLTGKAMPWSKAGYRWVKRQAWGEPMSWVSITN